MCFQRVSHVFHSVWVQSHLWAVVEQRCLWSHCSDIAHSDCTVDDSDNNDVVIIIVVIIIIVREGGEGDREEDKDREGREEGHLLSSVKEAEEEEDTDYVDSDSCCDSAGDGLIDGL